MDVVETKNQASPPVSGCGKEEKAPMVQPEAMFFTVSVISAVQQWPVTNHTGGVLYSQTSQLQMGEVMQYIKEQVSWLRDDGALIAEQIINYCNI